MIIAVDGPAASGKGLLCRFLADFTGLPVLDTGLIYRMVAYELISTGQSVTDVAAAVAVAKALDPERYVDANLRSGAMGEGASVVSAIPEVRAALNEFQRSFARAGGILDGRDIGTVICPDADFKFFLTAAPETRAFRRYTELVQQGEQVTYDQVLADIRRRDERDSSRSVAPLRMADDAILIDTTTLAIPQMLDQVRALLQERVTGEITP